VTDSDALLGKRHERFLCVGFASAANSAASTHYVMGAMQKAAENGQRRK
jgi:hypothetical protein